LPKSAATLPSLTSRQTGGAPSPLHALTHALDAGEAGRWWREDGKMPFSFFLLNHVPQLYNLALLIFTYYYLRFKE
jgi:hypothetical protein